MEEKDLEDIEQHMRNRDHHQMHTQPFNHNTLLVLADKVPDLVAEVRRLNLQNGELLAALVALADRVSVRFGETIKYEPVATGRYLDAAHEAIAKAKVAVAQKTKCACSCHQHPRTCGCCFEAQRFTEKPKSEVKPPHAVRCECPECKQRYCDHAWAGEDENTACKYCGMKFYVVEKRKCDVTTKEGFRCGLDYGHENAHQIQIGYNS